MRLELPQTTTDGATITCGETLAAPIDLARWRNEVVFSGGRRVEARDEQELTSAAGWPVVLVRSDVVDAAGALVAARLHAFYILLDRVCVVWASAPEAGLIAAARSLVLAGRINWDTDELLALAQLWSDDEA